MSNATTYIILISLLIISFALIKLGVALLISGFIFCLTLMLLLIKIMNYVLNKPD